MNRYDFSCTVDDIFKQCATVEELCEVYTQLEKDLQELFRQNVTLKISETRGVENK